MLIALAAATASFGQSENLPDTARQRVESELRRVKEQLDKTSRTVEELARKEQDAQARSRELREETELLEDVRSRLQATYRNVDRAHSASDQQVRQFEEWKTLRQEVLARLLRTTYVSKAVSDASGLSASLPGKERRRYFVRLVCEAQTERLLTDTDSLAAWEHRRSALAESRRELRTAVSGKQREQRSKERLAARSEREAFAYRQQREEQFEQVEQMQRDALMLSELIDRLVALHQAQGGVDYDFPGWHGRLRWPLSGEVKSTVGRQIDPRYHTETSETGVFLAGAPGTPVVSAADGEIVYAGRRRGLGNVVIVGHGAEYFSIFAHLGDISVREGQVVRAGAPLGTAGESHPRFGAGVLFELRHGKGVLDPLEWLK